MSIPAITERLLKSSTQNKDGFIVASYADDFIYRERAFTTNQIYDVPTGTNLLFLFDPRAEHYVVALPFSFSSEDGPFVVSLYAGTDYTGGNDANVFNRFTSSSNINDVLVTYSSTGGITGSTKGSQVSQYLVGSGGGPQSRSGGVARESLPFIINTNIKYLLEVENQSTTNPAMFEIRFTWYEGNGDG